MRCEKRTLYSLRLLSIYGYEVIGSGHNNYALIELDLMDIRPKLKADRRNGLNVSFFSFILSTIAIRMDKNKEHNDILRGKQIYCFDEIDIDIPIELKLNGVSVLQKYIVRTAATKTTSEMTEEIDKAKKVGRNLALQEKLISGGNAG
jgi:hypothetical protein